MKKQRNIIHELIDRIDSVALETASNEDVFLTYKEEVIHGFDHDETIKRKIALKTVVQLILDHLGLEIGPGETIPARLEKKKSLKSCKDSKGGGSDF